MARKFFHKIVVAVNGRQSSVRAAMYAIMMAKTYGLEVKCVFVVDTATIKYLTMNKLLINDEKVDFEERLEKDGEHYLSYVEMLAATKGVKIQKELRKGAVFTEILKVTEEFEADLLLIGGRDTELKSGNIKKNFLSSDENEVLINAKCPVLIVQKPEIEAQFKVF